MRSEHAVPVARAKLRRVFRFSLRTLLIAVTAFGVWLGVKLHQAREQRAAVKEIRALGGWVHYDYQRQFCSARPALGTAVAAIHLWRRFLSRRRRSQHGL